ncbi:MAG TPA: glycosyltransferase family 2 protein [Caulobacteraceae bacterium]|nr:glycosyltransferase family 2 protein [Caulobacteraceae bacterium]
MSRRKPKVAVLLSTYNGEAFLAAQLDSLLAQESVSLEVFARDDGSSDGTLAILERYSPHWPALATPIGGHNLGPAQSFLALLAAAPGDFDYYAFCDQDDVWLPGKLARAASRLGVVEGKPALYCSRVICADENLRPLGERWIRGDNRFEHLLYENIAFGTTVVLNAAARSGIVSKPLGPGPIMHDWWCALWTAAFGEIVHDDRWAGVLYRQHGRNVLGARPTRLGEIISRLRLFRRDPDGFWPVRRQAGAFLRLHGDQLGPSERAAIDALLNSDRSFWARVRFAFSRRVVRGDSGLTARLLILVDRY